MLMIVFGAGASYDAVPSYPASGRTFRDERLPLANQLFENRSKFAEALNLFPQCQPIIPYLREGSKNRPIEQIMQSLLLEANQYMQRNMQLWAIRYYLQFIIWQCEEAWMRVANGVTNHITLLDQIQSWRKPDEDVCFVTFNYDTLLERALRTIGINIRHLPDYIGKKGYKLIKLHGSVNWAHKVDLFGIPELWNRPKIITNLIDYSGRFRLIPGYETIDNPPPSANCESGFSLVPAIAIPIETKNEFECPPEFLDSLRKMIPQVDKVISVGWRGTEKPFLQLLAENLPHEVKVQVVAESLTSALATKENIEQAGLKGKFKLSEDGFTEFIINREADEFLRS